MRLIVLCLVVLVTGVCAGDDAVAALTARIHELKTKLNDMEHRIANADNEDVKAQAQRQAEELRGAIERAAQELKAAQKAQGAREKPEGAREKPARGPDALEGALKEARKALDSKNFEAAGGALKRAVEILAGMVNRPELGPEDAKWCRGQIEKLMGGAAAFKSAGREDMAEYLQQAAKKLLAALDARKSRESAERTLDGAKLEAHLRELTKERENLGRRMEELEGARREIAQDVERREAAVREAEGEKREALKRELEPALAKLKRVNAELEEVKAHAAKLEAQRAQIAAELRKVRREGDRERPPGENREFIERMRDIDGAVAENTEIANKLRREIAELEGAASKVEGERREGLRREFAELREQLMARERNLQQLRRQRAELEKAAGVPRREPEGRNVERDRPDDMRAEIEALRAEVRELRRLLQEALKRD